MCKPWRLPHQVSWSEGKGVSGPADRRIQVSLRSATTLDSEVLPTFVSQKRMVTAGKGTGLELRRPGFMANAQVYHCVCVCVYHTYEAYTLKKFKREERGRENRDLRSLFSPSSWETITISGQTGIKARPVICSSSPSIPAVRQWHPKVQIPPVLASEIFPGSNP